MCVGCYKLAQQPIIYESESVVASTAAVFQKATELMAVKAMYWCRHPPLYSDLLATIERSAVQYNLN